MINGYMLLGVMGVGVLLTGYEDAKLGVTMSSLLERGHKLVTDNNLIIRRMAENDERVTTVLINLAGIRVFIQNNIW